MTENICPPLNLDTVALDTKSSKAHWRGPKEEPDTGSGEEQHPHWILSINETIQAFSFLRFYWE